MIAVTAVSYGMIVVATTTFYGEDNSLTVEPAPIMERALGLRDPYELEEEP